MTRRRCHPRIPTTGFLKRYGAGLMTETPILVGTGEHEARLLPAFANRHGLIAGATGTGKTITLQVLAESLSAAGVPVLCADVKGDLAGLSQPGAPNPKLEQRASRLGVHDYSYRAAPVVFWDVFGVSGHKVRATVAEMGPILLSRMLELNDTQEGVLSIAFAVADDEGLLLLDYKDLRAVLSHVAERAGELGTEYGNVSKATIGTIQRRLLRLEQEGGEAFFGEPALELADLLLITPDGRGAVNILAADRLIHSPRLYATVLLWLLSTLYETLPEVGDLARPKLVFFFDEAHLLFDDAPKALVDKVTQVARLIRSKGVGVYFVTQNPLDIPASVLGQLGNRVQHALRAFTPADQKAVRAAADTFRQNPRLNTEEAIGSLAVGEALVSFLDESGSPSVVQKVQIVPPRSRIGAITAEERAEIIRKSPVGTKYDASIDRISAYERLSGRATSSQQETAPVSPAPVEPGGDPWGTAMGPAPLPPSSGQGSVWNSNGWQGGLADSAPYPPQEPVSRPAPREVRTPSRNGEGGGWLGDVLGSHGGRQGLGEAFAKSVIRSLGSQVGTKVGGEVLRGILGSILKR
ncbi:ATPase [Granulibacter bethesdensis CGDNIH1]|uniref:ATPase n=2 Tax=Granulibacter bethesdensis TaxID=364410 RepID=Q0BTT5_GRABC|nr:ATPase [Granulibacter bethesdensis CGDNIH1]APH51577.1 ATPase [Granulibacter bethesdensis]APH64270.1 ATPase [Granulibacter bethesdensis]